MVLTLIAWWLFAVFVAYFVSLALAFVREALQARRRGFATLPHGWLRGGR
jgi:hypothetical protein